MSNLDTVTTNITSNSAFADANANYWCFMCEKEFSRSKTDSAEVYCPDCSCISELIEPNDDPRNFKPYDAQTESSQATAHTSSQNLEQPTIMRQASQRQQRQLQRPTEQSPSIPRVNIIYRTLQAPSDTAVAQGPSNDPNDIMQARRNQRAQLHQRPVGIAQHRIQIIPIEGNVLNPLLGGAFGMLLPGLPISGHIFEDLEGRIIEEFLRNDPNRYGPPPAPEESVNKLKEISFNEETCKAKDCSVCQEDYKNGENLLVMPCEHTFHKDCVKKWLSMHNSCPVCRKPLEGREQTDA